MYRLRAVWWFLDRKKKRRESDPAIVSRETREREQTNRLEDLGENTSGGVPFSRTANAVQLQPQA